MARVLIVLDGSYRFATGAMPAGTADFTYETLYNALVAAGHQVTKAHRQSDSTATHQNFNFATPPAGVKLLDFDVMWLIGNQGRNHTFGGTSAALPAPELKAIARFMAAGGGVFATGDHDSIGSNMCGHIPRVRAMRSWYGPGDGVSPMPAAFPRNFLPVGAARADTTRRNPGGNYGADMTFVWFENQSDSVPQPIVPTSSPAHPILRRGGTDIVIYPDHMHEGNTFGDVNAADPNYPGASYDYTQSISLDGQSFVEFPMVAGNREMPKVIATGQTTTFASKYVASEAFVGSDSAVSLQRPVNTLAVYDGRTVGVGRIVTGSTFHHYVDINLTGDSGVTPALSPKVGPNAEKGHGFNDAPAGTFDDIKQVFVNITNWLARPRPAIQLILERSTFSQDEAIATPNFEAAILVIVDGLKPNQLPGGGVTSLVPAAFQPSWAPTITALEPAGLSIVPTGVDSDDPMLLDRVQRLTFTYRVQITAAAAFGFAEMFNHVQLDASLSSAGVSAPLTDSAQITLVKSANPFMLDLANNNETAWLSSDVRVFRAIAGETTLGKTLPANANRTQALQYLREVLQAMTIAQFENQLSLTQTGSALSPFAETTVTHRKVYNFAVARVRLNQAAASANVRVFFRIVPSPTTAALTYQESMGVPIGSYRDTGGADPIALPGINGAGNDWVSFPCFLHERMSPPESQVDNDNRKPMGPTVTEVSTFFGALLDNNLTDGYLPATPGGMGAPVPLPDLMMGEHQCIVAQIKHAGAPIPSGANPFTSDKLSQRNLAFSAVANPGLDASRWALHTFEIEATPHPISDALPPDELLLDWRGDPPDGTEVRLVVPGWDAARVVELADRFYPRHEIRVVDAHTVALPGGGTRYIPIPTSLRRETGVLIVDLPLGITKGQRFDLAVRQVSTRGRQVEIEPPKVTTISKAEAARLLQTRQQTKARASAKTTADTALPLGVFELGDNRVLVTDLRVFDAEGDHAAIIEHPDAATVEAARRRSGSWRETIGAFQLGIPVEVKADMLAHHVRLLSVLRWRAEQLRPNSRWYDTFIRYVQLIAEKVRALGGDPWAVPATPDGAIPLPGKEGEDGGGGDIGSADGGDPLDPFFEPGEDDWLSGTSGLGGPDKARPALRSGKVSGLLFDHFGDFEGFTLEIYDGSHRRFFSRETAIRDLTEAAWLERYVVTVITVSATSRRVRRLLIRGYSD